MQEGTKKKQEEGKKAKGSWGAAVGGRQPVLIFSFTVLPASTPAAGKGKLGSLAS